MTMFLGVRPQTRDEKRTRIVEDTVIETVTDDDGNEEEKQLTVEREESYMTRVKYKECWIEEDANAVRSNLDNDDLYFEGFEYYRIEFEGGIDGPAVLVKVE